MKPSKYQREIYQTVLDTNSSIVISAGPGSGKTTTIIEASKLVPVNKKSVFVAFNKSIVSELETRLTPNVKCSTIHSLGMRALYQYYSGERMGVSEYKTADFVREYLKRTQSDLDSKEKFLHGIVVSTIIDFIRMTYCNPKDVEQIESVLDRYSLEYNGDHIKTALAVWDDLMEYNLSPLRGKEKRKIDFVDMIYLPVFLSGEKILPTFDVVFVDEGQDLNEAQQRFIQLIKKKNGRIILVGDKKQAIYGFTGSSVDNFNNFEAREDVISLPLSVCYRCDQKIVRLARMLYDDVEAFEGNEEGIVREGNENEIQPGDMVVCRNTRPLIELYFQLIQQRKKAYILGRDIEKSLVNLISPFSDVSTEELVGELYLKLKKVAEELKKKSISKPELHPKFANFLEKIIIIRLIGERCSNGGEIEAEIKNIFAPDKDAVRLCTMHKAKGLENDRVFILEKELLPSEYALHHWQKIQEKNLLFVAITRAKKELVFIQEQSEIEDNGFPLKINKYIKSVVSKTKTTEQKQTA